MKPIAVIVLGQNSIPVARKLMAVLPEATLYGLVERTEDVDVSYSNFGETLRQLFSDGTAIIGFCATGIVIRTLAPLLTDKRYEPPVLAVAEDGSAVVPLLGGLHGVNDLARVLAAALAIQPAITTTGDIRFRTALLAPPAGYHLANPEAAKTFIADLLAGETLRLEGQAPWLSESLLPIQEAGKLTICVTETVVSRDDYLVYHPATLAIAVGQLSDNIEPEKACNFVQQVLENQNLAVASVAAIFADKTHMGHPALAAITQKLQVPIRFFKETQTVEEIALKAVGNAGKLMISQQQLGINLAVAIAPKPLNPDNIGQPQGKLAIVGTGPGGVQWMSPEVQQILRQATDWVGYKVYLDLAGTLGKGQQRHDSDNREELDRARFALNLAAEGKSVAVVSSGDPGIFAMAAAVFEALESAAKPEWQGIEIQVAPGISAMQAVSAATGAPLGHDFCVLSLSDLLKPWAVIEQRLLAAAEADLAIAIYNPISKQRTWQLGKARTLLLQKRSPETPVILGRNLGRAGQSLKVCTLAEFNPESADMRTLIIIGSSQTRIIERKYGGVWVYTPRRYD